MKTITLILLMAAAAAAQDRSTAAPAQKGAPAVSADTAPALPKGAVEIEPNLYRYTDSHGKTMLARRTPFGLSSWEDKPAPPQPAARTDSAPPIKATDLGDSVRFQSKTPFGTSTWVKKKTELTGEEREWLARSGDAGAVPQSKPVPSGGNATEKQ
jgi:hypothetical protein